MPKIKEPSQEDVDAFYADYDHSMDHTFGTSTISCPQCGRTRQSDTGPASYEVYNHNASCKCGYSPSDEKAHGDYDWNDWN